MRREGMRLIEKLFLEMSLNNYNNNSGYYFKKGDQRYAF